MTERLSLSDQLSRAYPDRPRVRLVSQLDFGFVGDDPREAINTARLEVLKWMKRKIGFLPHEAWEGEPFALDPKYGHYAEAIVFDTDETYLWAAQNADQDKSVAQRTWVTEIALGTKGERARGGIMLSCVTRGEDRIFDPTVPGFIRQLAQRPGIIGSGLQFPDAPFTINDEEALEQLIAHLCNPDRRHLAFVLSLAESSGSQGRAALNAYELSRRCLGLAHVFILSGAMAWELTRKVGKEFSVYNRAVRTYLPGLDFNEGWTYRHPLATAETIGSWSDGSAGFVRFLTSRALEYLRRQPGMVDRLPSFAKIKRGLLAEQQMEAQTRVQRAEERGIISTELVEGLRAQVSGQEDHITALTVQLEHAERERDANEEEFYQAQDALEVSKRDNFNLGNRVDSLEASLQATGRSIVPPIPSSLNELEEWAAKHLAGKLILLARAARGAKKSEFEMPQLVFKGLLLLGHEYRQMKRFGGPDNMARFAKKAKELRISEEPTHSGTRAGEEGDTYYADFRGSRRYLERHLKKGASRDPRRCLRIYFFWDDEEQVVVVGWLPSHLKTRAS